MTASIAADGQTSITAPLKLTTGTAALPSYTFAAALTSGMYYAGTSKLGFSGGGTAMVFMDGGRVGTGQDGAIISYANGAILTPVGSITDFAGSTAPSGWLLCYGQIVAQASYPELFQVIGSTYNTGGEGVNNFRLPDCRGRATYGQDNMGGSSAGRITNAGSGIVGTTLGANGGVESVTLATANLPPYTPTGTNSAGVISTKVRGRNDTLGAGATLFATTTVSSTNPDATDSSTLTTPPVFTGVAQGGVSTPMSNVAPAIIFNKIIFAGRP